MTLRITPNIMVAKAVESAARHNARLAELQQQAATGLRINKPSDDPVASGSLVIAKATLNRIETQLSNINDARLKLNLGVSKLDEANDLLSRARLIAMEGIQSTEPAEREMLAREVEGILNNLMEVANSQYEGQYLFGGANPSDEPFQIMGSTDSDPPPVVNYQGSDLRSATMIGPDHRIDVMYTGAEIFASTIREDTVIVGSTGAASGTGTDNGHGQATLQVAHTLTSFAAGSGVQAGTDSVAGDTILGPAGAHVLTVVDTAGDGSAGTVSLNGGPAIAFTNADTNLMVTGANGEIIYVDTTAITPGFNGDVDITSDGTLSTDDGATTVAIDYSGNQLLTNSVTGEVTNVDSTNIRQAGADSIEYVGASDAFTALMELRNDLRNTRNLSSDQLSETFGRRIADLERIRENVMFVAGEQSLALQNLENLEYKAQDVQVETLRYVSELESADIVEVVTQLQNEQTLLQFGYASLSLVMDQTFLDFIR